jgi:peptidoglycan biosynthesis protein MviN/MurJ (putative lipid II flippase)
MSDDTARWTQANEEAPPGTRTASAASAAQYAASATGRTNGRSTLALVFALFGFGLPAVIFGHIARHEVKRTGDSGGQVAAWALALGYLELLALPILAITFAAILSAILSGIARPHP